MSTCKDKISRFFCWLWADTRVYVLKTKTWSPQQNLHIMSCFLGSTRAPPLTWTLSVLWTHLIGDSPPSASLICDTHVQTFSLVHVWKRLMCSNECMHAFLCRPQASSVLFQNIPVILMVTLNSTSNCKILVLVQLYHSLMARRSSWESSQTAPSCWTRHPVTKRGSASRTSCWLIAMKCALQTESTMWVCVCVSVCMCEEAAPHEQHLALVDKALYPQIP